MTRRLALLALTLAASTYAQQPPKMSAEGKKFLEGWIGSWTANDVAYTMGDQKMKGSLKMTCESVSAGWGTLCKGTFTTPPNPPSEGTFMMGWDIATGLGHMFEISDTGEVHDHAGRWINATSVALVRTGKTLDGKIEKDTCTATWVSANELKFDCTGAQAGATVWTFSSTSKK